MERFRSTSYPHPVDRRDRARARDFYPSGLNPLLALIPELEFKRTLAVSLDMVGTHIGCGVVRDDELLGSTLLDSELTGSLESLLRSVMEALRHDRERSEAGSTALATLALASVAANAQQPSDTAKAESDRSSNDPGPENESLLGLNPDTKYGSADGPRRYRTGLVFTVIAETEIAPAQAELGPGHLSFGLGRATRHDHVTGHAESMRQFIVPRFRKAPARVLGLR